MYGEQQRNMGPFSTPHIPLFLQMKFTLVEFSCKQYVDIVAARASHQVAYM